MDFLILVYEKHPPFYDFFFSILESGGEHYNIGKYHDRTTQLDLPSQEDWIKIVVVMLLFAGLQGILTC